MIWPFLVSLGMMGRQLVSMLVYRCRKVKFYIVNHSEGRYIQLRGLSNIFYIIIGAKLYMRGFATETYLPSSSNREEISVYRKVNFVI